MSMLDRYRKPGGFVQLLALVEACHPTKQEKLLDIIGQEDYRWSQTVRTKMLSIQRIYSWNDQALAEVFGSLQDLTVAVALHAAEPELKLRVVGFFARGRVRKIEDLLSSKGPTEAEVAATHMKIIESVRKMGSDGFLRFESVDPVLVIGDDIDSQLSHTALPGETARVKTPVRPVADAGHSAPKVLHSYSHMNEHLASRGEQLETAANGGSSTGSGPVADINESRLAEVQSLKKRVADLSKENATLRHDLSIVKAKLDQIKKIA
jgi:hypothetical protein